MIKQILAGLLITVSCGLCVACNKPDDPTPPQQTQYVFPKKENVVTDRQYYTGINEVVFANTLWNCPAAERAPQYDRPDQGAQAYFLESVNNENDTPTQVFAFVGIPATATKNNPVPGIVLVHGGGGTAFPDWVKMWNDRGYAAIAIDTEGKIPAPNTNLTSATSLESTKNHGPGNTNYSDYAKPANQQFLYHAIAGTIVANSFLSSFEQVDSTKIGLTGISWGGVIITNAAAYDDRFAFVAPVYGAVAMTGTTGIFGDLYNNYPRCAELWDNVDILKTCRTPMLFVNWHGDPYFTVDATEKCVNTAINGRMILIPNLQHGHLQGASVQEILVFANSVINN